MTSKGTRCQKSPRPWACGSTPPTPGCAWRVPNSRPSSDGKAPTMTDDIPPLEHEIRALLDEVEGPRSTISRPLQAAIEERLQLTLRTGPIGAGIRPHQLRLRNWLTIGA